MAVRIARVLDGLPEDFAGLRRDAVDEGYLFLERLAEEVEGGDYAGVDDLPVLFCAFVEGDLAAVGGLTPDPYDPEPGLARIRHVYVRPAHRRGGVGRTLAAALVQQGLAIAERLSLRAADGRAVAFWDAQGFARDLTGATRTHLLTR